MRVDVLFTFITPPRGTATDCLDDTICYFQTVQRIQAYGLQKEFHLIEHLAYDIYTIIVEGLAGAETLLEKLTVTVHKVAPPIPGVHGGVSFTYGGPGAEEK